MFYRSIASLALACMFAGSAFAQVESDAARQRVFEFEFGTLRKAPEAERPELVRRYFASLKDADMRIAAIGMTDSRYVYYVPRSVMDEVLAPLLNDPDPRVQARAVKAIGYNGLGGRHAERLLALLKMGDLETKNNVFYAMGRSKDARFKSPLQAAVRDADPLIRSSAAYALFGLDPKAKEVEALLSDPEPTVRSAIVWMRPDSPRTPALLRDPAALVRAETARILGQTEDDKHIPAIAPLLADADAQVRLRAAEALAKLGSARDGDRIEKLLLNDPEAVVRRTAAEALAVLRLPKHLPGLRKALRDQDETVQRAAARAIRLVEDPSLHPQAL